MNGRSTVVYIMQGIASLPYRLQKVTVTGPYSAMIDRLRI